MSNEDIEQIGGLDATRGELNEIIREKKQLFGYLIISGIVLIVALGVCRLIELSAGQSFFVMMILMLILALLYSVNSLSNKQENENRVAGMKEGWMVTWADKWRHYTKAPKESTLLLVYGIYLVYENGKMESKPDSFRLTFYKTNYMPMFINPYLRSDIMIYKMIENEYGEIAWVDGTDRYWSAFERELYALEVEA